ncbi:MAG: extracellular catalytic domain type 1 short-chain-length polyhydroxyalkanoate depolymerase [Rhodoplanes sp.]
MFGLSQTLANLTRNRKKLEEQLRAAERVHARDADIVAPGFDEDSSFGSNPGNLRMLSYAPPRLAANPPLVVVLHGCAQTAADYNHGAGWSTLADRYGFVLLLPEQHRSNNSAGCFNWFEPGDIQRGKGEALSIRQMVEKIIVDKGIDRRRVFITGLSAGAAMTSVMLACYPEVFAAGAIIGGLPYGAATNVQQALQSMSGSPARPAQAWGDLVRGAARHNGPWPRVSVWHGSADKTVIPSNAREILKQWTNVHGLPETPSVESMVDGYPRKVWVNRADDELIESYTIMHMAHGTPIATGEADEECGAAGPFLLEVGISSSYHIAKFFGLTKVGPRKATLKNRRSAPISSDHQPFQQTRNGAAADQSA